MQVVRTNLKINASTQYSNFNYNSMCVFNGQVLGAGANGLMNTCEGDDDYGTNIDAYFIPIMTNFGTLNPKRLWSVYVGVVADADLLMTLSGDDSTIEAEYSIPINTDKTNQTVKVTVSKIPLNAYWKFKFNNVEGGDFMFNTISAFVKERIHSFA